MSSGQPIMLVVDDEPAMLQALQRFGEMRHFTVVARPSGTAALEYLHTGRADFALVDVRMPGVDGIEVLRQMAVEAPECQVVLMTGSPDMAIAVEAIKLGAQDVLAKPLDLQQLSALLDGVRAETERRRELRGMERQLASQLTFQGMVGRSAPMTSMFSLIRRLAPHVRTAIVTGETGTGKELVARALHTLGPRSKQPLVMLNCSAMVPTLIESELFGHARGAFTGAVDAKAGLFEVAHQGTLFLDEIAELPVEVQAKLLRVLDSGELLRVGSTSFQRVDVHVIAATHRDLGQAVEAGRFRADLFYRLQVVEVRVPPLRERREDIPFLVASFVGHFARLFELPIVGVTPEAEQMLMDGSWPGNVRQLRNTIERACLLAESEWISEKEIRVQEPVSGPRAPSDAGPAPSPRTTPVTLEELQHALANADGNKARAARDMGISRRALYRALEGFGLA